MCVFLFLVGVWGWTLTEYLMHRFVGHVYGASTFFGKTHRAHHAEKDLFLPLGYKIASLFKVGIPLGVITSLFFGASVGVPFTAGFAMAFIGYEWLHHTLHVSRPKTAYGRWARRHHFYHHFEAPGANFGVTSPLWDFVFGTAQRAAVIRVPRKFAMRWLTDADVVDVFPDYHADYVLRGRL